MRRRDMPEGGASGRPGLPSPVVLTERHGIVVCSSSIHDGWRKWLRFSTSRRGSAECVRSRGEECFAGEFVSTSIWGIEGSSLFTANGAGLGEGSVYRSTGDSEICCDQMGTFVALVGLGTSRPRDDDGPYAEMERSDSADEDAGLEVSDCWRSEPRCCSPRASSEVPLLMLSGLGWPPGDAGYRAPRYERPQLTERLTPVSLERISVSSSPFATASSRFRRARTLALCCASEAARVIVAPLGTLRRGLAYANESKLVPTCSSGITRRRRRDEKQ